jgi:thioredoxin-dependent peroxiredoxin
MLKEGDKAPDFELPSVSPDEDHGKVRLSALKGKPVVVYFYPRDNTPGCTREAQGFSAAKRDFAKRGAVVLGISKDSVASHCGFRDKYAINFSLLSDPDLKVHKAYGAWGEKMMYGKKVTGVIRSTFVIGPDGRVVKAFPSVKVDGHVDAVLRTLAGDHGGPPKVKSTARPAPKRASKTPARPAPKGASKASARRASTRAAKTKRR